MSPLSARYCRGQALFWRNAAIGLAFLSLVWIALIVVAVLKRDTLAVLLFAQCPIYLLIALRSCLSSRAEWLSQISGDESAPSMGGTR